MQEVLGAHRGIVCYNSLVMIFIFVSIFVPIATYIFLPLCLKRITETKVVNDKKLLIIAGLLFFISWYLPSPEIQGEQTAAVTHFVGGGVFTGIVWLYVKNALRWKANWLMELLGLLALVSLLGVANELFELFLTTAGVVSMTLADTSWDLLMNTLGALAVWFLYRVHRLVTR
jgi:hypothetical protein